MSFARRARRFIPACAGNARAPGWRARWHTVHPRVCGERTSWPGGAIRFAGSSPRVRGTPRRPSPPSSRLRFIPACAGNTLQAGMRFHPASVHPRVCGERVALGVEQLEARGSSPRVRGTRRTELVNGRVDRFIPACAGNAVGRPGAGGTTAVHPRVCGERHTRKATATWSAGSSPRVRGTPKHTGRVSRRGRFIPACAGNAPPRPRAAAARPVHPRVCGERSRIRYREFRMRGSSPRVRGTRPAQIVDPVVLWFIPEFAGNAPKSSIRNAATTVHPRVCGERGCSGRPRRSGSVHPRVCGERANRALRVSANFGSSPRMRGTRICSAASSQRRRFIPAYAGTLHAGHVADPPMRFIPAYAGNARPQLPSPMWPSVHPRVCGERGSSSIRSSNAAGSSPRMRGTRGERDHVFLRRRFIPACAGNARRAGVAHRGGAVHPRVCGERLHSVAVSAILLGSSPRVRGTPRSTASDGSRPQVHPRVCGERTTCRIERSATAGSSPRVRGTPTARGCAAVRIRFIPACAGNASRAARRGKPTPVHPRVCGERLSTIFSPCARPRFIPACAGNAGLPANTVSVPSVHPRVCGERPCGVWCVASDSGSSPRVRGTRGGGHSS